MHTILPNVYRACESVGVTQKSACEPVGVTQETHDHINYFRTRKQSALNTELRVDKNSSKKKTVITKDYTRTVSFMV